MSTLATIFFLLLGVGSVIVWLVVYSLTHQKQIKQDLQSGQKNVPYSQKISANYTPAEKRWALITGLVMVMFCGISCYFLFVLHQVGLASGSIFVGLMVWKGMISLGDKVTKGGPKIDAHTANR